MYGVQQQVQPTPLPPCFRPTPPNYGPPPPPFQPCGPQTTTTTTVPPPPPRPFPKQPPVVTARPGPEPCPQTPIPIPAAAPTTSRCRQNRPAPLPLQGQAFPEPSSTPPFQEVCPANGGNVVYQRVRTYSSPGGKFSNCSARAPSPFEGGSPGYQRVVWSSDPPLQEVSSPSLKLTPYSQGSIRRIILENPDQEPLSPLLRGGNNVIYEKTIRKYELLNPDHEKQYQYALQHTLPDQCHISPPQPVDHVQVTQHQCQNTQTGNCYDIGPVSVNDAGMGTVKRVIIQPCEPVPCVQQTNDQLDSRYFGELLAELHHKSVELHNCLLLHVEKLGGRTFDIESLESTEDIESLIPKGLSELTKQQIRYLLEMRVTANKSLKLVLATFSNLREELVHLQDDLGKLESDKMLLEKDLAFKDAQVKEYETLLASVRENNRQQQQALREYTVKCRSLEEQLLSLRLNDGERDFRLKDLEYSKRALEQEIQNLKLQASSNPLGQTTTDELSSRYVEMINQLREDKDREIRNLRSQVCQFQTDFSKKQGTDIDLQMKLQELNFRLEEKETYIKQQEEELFRLKQEKLAINPSQGITKTIITKRYRNQYPILGLLSDDYKATSPVKESQTIVIEKTGERWKQESFTTD